MEAKEDAGLSSERWVLLQKGGTLIVTFAQERRARGAARSPLSRGRVSQTASGDIVLRLKRGWSDGMQALVFTAPEFVEKLAALVPPARKNLVSYHGVRGARSARRSEVVPKAPETEPRGAGGEFGSAEARTPALGGPAVPGVRGGRVGVCAVWGANAAAWSDVAAAVDGCAAASASECGPRSAGGG